MSTNAPRTFFHIGKEVDPTILSYDQLAFLYGFYQDRSIDRSLGERARTIAMNKREAIRDAIGARGLMVQRSFDGGFMVGPPSFFEPIKD